MNNKRCRKSFYTSLNIIMSQIISIEGNIGSGKSTLLHHLKDYFKDNTNIIFLQEPVDEWNKIKDINGKTILEKFYENQQKYSFAFQMMAYISRLSMLKKCIEENPNSIIITERCLNTDKYVFAKMLYDDNKIEDVEYQIYLNWFDNFSYLEHSQKVVYLKTDSNICAQRINKRNRLGENNIQFDYLENCEKYHENMLNEINNEKLIIDTNIDTEINKDIIIKWCNMIKNFIFT